MTTTFFFTYLNCFLPQSPTSSMELASPLNSTYTHSHTHLYWRRIQYIYISCRTLSCATIAKRCVKGGEKASTETKDCAGVKG